MTSAMARSFARPFSRIALLRSLETSSQAPDRRHCCFPCKGEARPAEDPECRFGLDATARPSLHHVLKEAAGTSHGLVRAPVSTPAGTPAPQGGLRFRHSIRHSRRNWPASRPRGLSPQRQENRLLAGDARNGETRTRTGDTTLFSRVALSLEFSEFAGTFAGSREFGEVHHFPHFAVVCSVKRPTTRSAGLFLNATALLLLRVVTADAAPVDAERLPTARARDRLDGVARAICRSGGTGSRADGSQMPRRRHASRR